MDPTSKLLPLLLAIRRLWMRALPGRIGQALKWLLGRLALCWATLRSKSGPSGKRRPANTPASDSQSPDSNSRRTIRQSGMQQIKKQVLDLDDNYVTITGGEIVVLDHILPSVYPHSGDGLRSAAQSSKNLAISRSAHASTISLSSNAHSLHSRTLSRQSFNDRGSQYTASVHSGSHINVSVISPPNSPPNDTHSVGYTENADSTRSANQSLYLQPANSSSHSGLLLSPLSRQNDRLSATSPTLEGDDTNPLSTDIVSPPNDNQTCLVSLDQKAAHKIGESVHDVMHIPRTCLHNLCRSCVALADERITPIMPEAIDRYDNRPTISKHGGMTLEIEPFTITYETAGTPEGWIKYDHPEGACYFFNPTERIYVEANLHDETIRNHAMADIDIIQEFLRLHNPYGIDLSSTELVINVGKDNEGTLLTSYYFVHHGTRAIFFLDKFQSKNLKVYEEIYGGYTSESHLRHEIESQYWYHCQFYPHSSTLTKEKIQELRDVVLHYIGDTMTSPKGSTAPYSIEDLRNILGYANDLDQNVGGLSVGAHSCLARLMFVFTRARFLHFHGEPHARIDRTTSVYGDEVYGRTWLVELLSPILFCSPDFHLKNLQGLWVDQIMHKSIFKESMERMNSDWDRIVLFATVMLNANVAFLAIQSIDNINTPIRSATQISSYVSMIASIGSIVIGLLLSRQNRTKLRETVDEFQQYLSSKHHPTLGLETLAILYSLPYALLMWGMIAFFSAVALLCFVHSDLAAISVAAISCFFCMMFSLWCVYTNWDSEGNKRWDAFRAKVHGRFDSTIAIIKLGRRPNQAPYIVNSSEPSTSITV